VIFHFMTMRTHLQFVPFVVDGFETVSVMELGSCNIKLVTRARIDARFSISPNVSCPVISQHCMRE
jgi:hypothetical protein